MSATVENLIIKGCNISYCGNLTDNNKRKFRIIASRFSTVQAFVQASIEQLNGFRTVEGIHCFRPLTIKETQAILNLQELLSPEDSIQENFIKILTYNFIEKQTAMLNEMSIEKLNSNPLLCKTLNFRSAEELVRYNAYSAISRSIVTSMGFLIQDLLLYSSEEIYDGKNDAEGKDTKFDVVIDRLDGVRSYIELKSGPNDLDAAQVKHYAREIAAVEKHGLGGFIGIAYGKKDSPSVSFGLLESYLPDWLNKTLIGQELWDYVTENPDYHNILLTKIEETSQAVLGNNSIITEIENKIHELTMTFISRYSSLEEYYSTLW